MQLHDQHDRNVVQAAKRSGGPSAAAKRRRINKKHKAAARGTGVTRGVPKPKAAAQTRATRANAPAAGVGNPPAPRIQDATVLCAREPPGSVCAALATAVATACSSADASRRSEALGAAGAVVLAYCESCVAAHNLQAAWMVLRGALRLVQAHPEWRVACKEAVHGAQACVHARHGVHLELTAPLSF